MSATEMLYGMDGWEALCDSVDEVVETYMDGAEPNDIEWPIAVVEFRRMDASKQADNLESMAVERVLEYLDEEYGDPGDNYSEPTQAMKDAAKAFVGVILKEYKVWQCEPTGNVVLVTKAEALKMTGGDQQ